MYGIGKIFYHHIAAAVGVVAAAVYVLCPCVCVFFFSYFCECTCVCFFSPIFVSVRNCSPSVHRHICTNLRNIALKYPLIIHELCTYLCHRYRMVAKDFTLQQAVLPLTSVWVECHERMARWFILMDHKMQAEGCFYYYFCYYIYIYIYICI